MPFFMGEEHALFSADQKGTSEAVNFIISEDLREDDYIKTTSSFVYARVFGQGIQR